MNGSLCDEVGLFRFSGSFASVAISDVASFTVFNVASSATL